FIPERRNAGLGVMFSRGVEEEIPQLFFLKKEGRGIRILCLFYEFMWYYILVYQAVFKSIFHQLRRTIDVKFQQYISAVRFYGVCTDKKSFGNIFGSETVADQIKHIKFTHGKFCITRS